MSQDIFSTKNVFGVSFTWRPTFLKRYLDKLFVSTMLKRNIYKNEKKILDII